MNRRAFLSSTAALALAGSVWLRSRAAQVSAAQAETTGAPTGWRRFEITTRVTLLDAPGAAQLWLPLVQTAGGYQTNLDLRWQGSGRVDVAPDAKYGAAILKVVWDGASAESAAPKIAEVVQTVATRDRDGTDPVLPVTEAERRFWMQPTESTPTDGVVRETAERIVGGKTDPRARLRAIYDWVVDNTSRNPQTPGCGLGDIKSMLESGDRSGKCADINGLMTGLARAAGFPARDVYGIRVADSRQFRSLGASGAISNFAFLMYPCAFTATGQPDCLDPAHFRYEITSRELTA
jgi:Transglutaminase-like superfamily